MVLMSSPLKRLRIVVFPALSSPRISSRISRSLRLIFFKMRSRPIFWGQQVPAEEIPCVQGCKENAEGREVASELFSKNNKLTQRKNEPSWDLVHVTQSGMQLQPIYVTSLFFSSHPSFLSLGFAALWSSSELNCGAPLALHMCCWTDRKAYG